MDNFKLATKCKLRFSTPKGSLSTEQLWDLSLNALDSLAVELDEQMQQSGKKSFLKKTTQEDKVLKLQFDIVLEIMNTKNEEMQAASKAKEIKEHNDKIIALIAEKQDESLKGMSIEELQGMIKTN